MRLFTRDAAENIRRWKGMLSLRYRSKARVELAYRQVINHFVVAPTCSDSLGLYCSQFLCSNAASLFNADSRTW